MKEEREKMERGMRYSLGKVLLWVRDITTKLVKAKEIRNEVDDVKIKCLVESGQMKRIYRKRKGIEEECRRKTIDETDIKNHAK